MQALLAGIIALLIFHEFIESLQQDNGFQSVP